MERVTRNQVRELWTRLASKRALGDVKNKQTKKEHIINKTKLEHGNLKHLHVSKEVPTWNHNRGKTTESFWKSACCSACLKCL